ncbi:MAG: DUF5071 domain-containing protein [Lachnospiraceae bacterium]|nr:DUF5071 domain-containing protein [Lachnospiraceae bacterium]
MYQSGQYFQIDELLKKREYDIYNNDHIRDKEIMELAEVISADKSIDLKEYFDFLKASSKFCWFNYLKIIEKLPEEDKIRGISVLFELLQDYNWPTFQKTMEILEKLDKNVVETYINQYLAQAQEEDDEEWISNIQLLAKN